MKELMFDCWRKGYKFAKIKPLAHAISPALSDQAIHDIFRDVVLEHLRKVN